MERMRSISAMRCIQLSYLVLDGLPAQTHQTITLKSASYLKANSY